MKKALSLILVLIMCLSLCGCGDGEQNNETQGTTDTAGSMNDNETTDTTTATEFQETTNVEPTTAEILRFGFFWNHLNSDGHTAFMENGTTEPAGTWELDGNTVKCTWKDGSADNYDIKNINGNYMLVGDDHTLVSEWVNWDNIPQTTVELTLDNWEEYYELTTITYTVQNKDIWGDVTHEETTIAHVFKLKDKYFRTLRKQTDTQTLVRYNILDVTDQDRIITVHYASQIGRDILGTIVATGEGDVSDLAFEISRIQGTLCFVNDI